MSQILSSPSDCCNPCEDPVVENIPGPQGEQGPAGENGCTGTNAYTNTTAQFIAPAVNDDVTIDVGQSAWAGIGQIIHIEQAGYYEVLSRPTTTSLQVENLGYTGNAAPATNITSGVRVTAAGLQGPDGLTPGDALLVANNLSDVASPSVSRTNLGATTVGANLFTVANPGAIRFIRIDAANTVTLRDASGTRADLSLVLGANVQAFDALLAAIAALVTVADRLIYTTGVDTVSLTTLTAFGRSLIDDADAATARATMGKVLPRYGLLASKLSMDLNSAGSDNAVTVEATRYIIEKITVDNASVNMTTATIGAFTAALGGGVTLAADQGLTALTTSAKYDDLTLDAVVGTDVRTEATLYLRNGTAQSVAATADVRIWGFRID